MMHEDENVGYGRPPKSTRFKPGQSGNPRGRPRKTRDYMALLEKELMTPVTVTEGGKKMKMRKLDALNKAIVSKSLAMDKQALKLLVPALDNLMNRKSILDDEAAKLSIRKAIAGFVADIEKLRQENRELRERNAELSGLLNAELPAVLAELDELKRKEEQNSFDMELGGGCEGG